MKKRRWLSLFAVLLCACVCFSNPVIQQVSAWEEVAQEEEDWTEDDVDYEDNVEEDSQRESEEELSSLNSAYKELEAQKKELDQKINSIHGDKERKNAEKASMERQISLTTEQVKVLQDKIAYLEAQIADTEKKIEETQGKISRKEEDISAKEEEIEQKEQDILENTELLKQRVRANYMSGSPTLLSVLFGSDSFYDMLSNAEIMGRMVEYDDLLLQRMEEDREALLQAEEELLKEKEDLEKNKKDLESTVDQLEQSKAENQSSQMELDEKKKELDSQVASINSQIHSLASMEAAFYADKEAIMQDMRETQAEIDAIYAQLKGSMQEEFVGGEWGWPLPGYRPGAGAMFTSEFGMRFGGSDNHTGLDISGSNIYGKPIQAVNDGTVVFTNTNYQEGKGYGIYVMLDHGGGYTTLYAHCSALYVQVGQKVKRGETIAAVGSTGWSTGPHLHIEFRVNDVPQNPRNYLF